MIWLTILKALFTVVPMIIQMVREGRIVTGAQDEVLEGLFTASQARLDRARNAKVEGDEADDPFNRTR